ncbi:polyprenyl synthetase family protein [Cucumibacter marinus]|uniref:polyprenyl synthetase family protein n=1 Tax=Cucumibacter marinus TaxID=1121252 RepID=UPI00040D0315|nr:farnesyl diphosphate synthase [Cucumibacter marinus]
MTDPRLNSAITSAAKDVEDYLASHLDPAGNPDLAGTPERLLAAMRHGVLGGGKRLRPFLVRQSAALFDIAPEASIPAGAALELVHCFSLVHDDLPDMDNDELRRGQPTVWKAFDPALGILAGDALLSEAFVILADPACHADAAVRAALIAELARATGPTGMIGGQVLDIEGEDKPLTTDEIMTMQRMKTGALIRTGLRMGAILGSAGSKEREALDRWAEEAGLAYQIADDILDVTATSEALGKTAGKDTDQDKSTLVARLGLDGARQRLAACIEVADAALAPFGDRAASLTALIRYFAERQR